MKKQILLLALLLSVTASAFAEEAEINGLWYELVSKAKEATVIQYKYVVKYSGDIEIPETVEYEGADYSVTSIGDGAFWCCSGLTSVTIPNSVLSIGEGAFYDCTSLTSVTIPNSVTSIEEDVFWGCSSLTSVTIPNSVTIIGDYAFHGCSNLNSITIPNSVTSLGNYAFGYCRSLTSVIIPYSITNIGDGAFSDCSAIAEIIVEADNPIYDSRDNCHALIETATNTLVRGCNNSFIPNTITSIGITAFSDCCGLTSVTIPSSVTNIGRGAFAGCSGLTEIIVEEDNPAYDSRDNCHAIIETATNTLLFGCKNSNVPNSVTSIGNHAFYKCSDLASVTIGNSVKSIGDEAFRGCSNLNSITIPNSVTSLGNYAFSGCISLPSVALPSSVMSIGDGAFSGCSSMNIITIGSEMRTIGSEAFANLTELTDVFCNAENVPRMIRETYPYGACTNAFEGSNIENATLHVPTASIEAYRSTTPWNRFKTIMGLDGTIPETPKCATPTIAFVDGKLKFSCETEGVEFVSEVTVADAKKNYSSEVSLTGIYKVSVYATKAGYDNSDVATKEFTLGAGGEVCDVNKDGQVDVADIATIISRMAGKE